MFVFFFNKLAERRSLEMKIFDEIRTDYPKLRPSLNTHEPTIVRVALFINSIEGFNEKDQILTMSIRIVTYWKDDFSSIY